VVRLGRDTGLRCGRRAVLGLEGIEPEVGVADLEVRVSGRAGQAGVQMERTTSSAESRLLDLVDGLIVHDEAQTAATQLQPLEIAVIGRPRDGQATFADPALRCGSPDTVTTGCRGDDDAVVVVGVQ